MSVLQNVGETNSKSHSSDNAIETGSAKTVSPSVTIVDEDLFERLPLRPQASSTSRVPVVKLLMRDVASENYIMRPLSCAAGQANGEQPSRYSMTCETGLAP